MALSGTTLTVTTLTTAGLLTNNVSGQVSSVTGTSLASLLGGAPTFTGLTLSGLGSGLLKVTSGVVGVATGGDYQAPMSNGTNITITNGTVINVVSNPSFSGLTLSTVGLANTMLKTVSGVISAAIVNNDYQGALTAGSNISISSNTISIVTNPTFGNPTCAGINCSSVGSNNTLIGTQAGLSLLNSGLGSNTLLGSLAGSNITSGSQNIALGHLAGGVVTTGTYNTYIGTNARASSATVNNEIVISNTSSSVVGRGTNTAFINAPAGLFSYSPAFCQLRSTAFTNGVVTWQFWSDGTTTYNNGFQLLSSNTQVVQPFPGLYEVTVSGSAQAQSSLYCAIDLLTNNVKYQNIAYQSGSGISGSIVNVSGSQLSRPVNSTPINSGWIVYLTGGNFYSFDFPLFMTIKFISI